MKAREGFTLIELIVTVAVAAILAMIAIPSYQFLVTNNRMASEINDFVGSLHVARTEAIKSGMTVTLCVSTDGDDCATGTGVSWDAGWIVFMNPNGNQSVDDGEALLRVHGAFDGTDTLTGNAKVSNIISFNGSGFVTDVGNGTVTLNAASNEEHFRRCAVISTVGRVDLRHESECD